MSRFDIDRFLSPPDPEMVCSICQGVLDEPLESSCRHVFCSVCINTWLQNHNSNKSCPNCRSRLHQDRLRPVLPIVKNMLNRLPMQCENVEQGCAVGVLKLEDYVGHLKECQYAQTGCPNAPCPARLMRRELGGHLAQCQYRTVECERGCGLAVQQRSIDQHNCVQELKKSFDSLKKSHFEVERQVKSLFETVKTLKTRVRQLEDSRRRRRHVDYESSEESSSWSPSVEYSSTGFRSSDDSTAPHPPRARPMTPPEPAWGPAYFPPSPLPLPSPPPPFDPFPQGSDTDLSSGSNSDSTWHESSWREESSQSAHSARPPSPPRQSGSGHSDHRHHSSASEGESESTDENYSDEVDRDEYDPRDENSRRRRPHRGERSSSRDTSVSRTRRRHDSSSDDDSDDDNDDHFRPIVRRKRRRIESS